MTWLDTWRQWTGSTPTPPSDPHTYSTSALPGNLRRLRLARGLTISQLAALATVSGSTIRDIETPDYGPDGSRTNMPGSISAISMSFNAISGGVGK